MTTLLLLALVSLLVILIVAVVCFVPFPNDGARSVAVTRIGAQDAMRRAAEVPHRSRPRWGLQITVIRQDEQ